MGKLGYRSQTVIHHSLPNSKNLKYDLHHIFPSEISFLPVCSQRETICGLLESSVFCFLLYSEQLEEGCEAEHLLDFLIVLLQLAQVSVPHSCVNVSVHVNDFSCFFVLFEELLKLVFLVSWIELHLIYLC